MGTAYSTSSRVWFTLSHGILNEIYFPTIDHPQTRDMQFLITDGEHFFHEERRDLDSEVKGIEADALGYRVTTSGRDQGYRLIKEIISDPHQSCVLINPRLVWTPTRQVREANGGQILRIQAPEAFRLHWSSDGWVSSNDTLSTSTGIGVAFADIAIPAHQSALVQFTFLWTDSNRWEEHNYEVRVVFGRVNGE